jgi:uncharacterized protein (UPF0332 family)
MGFAVMLIEKAQESLKAAELCFGERLYNSASNRAYYAMFQAAVVALEKIGLNPKGEKWSHEGVQAMFATELTQRRKLYPSKFAQYLADGLFIRNRADYMDANISERQARRILHWAHGFLSGNEE